MHAAQPRRPRRQLWTGGSNVWTAGSNFEPPVHAGSSLWVLAISWLFSSFRPKMAFGPCREAQALQERAGSSQEWSSAWISIKTSSWCYDINRQVPIRSIKGNRPRNFFWLWGIVLNISICRPKIKLFLSDYSFCSDHQAQQSFRCHSDQFLCLPSYVTTPDKTLFSLSTFNKESVVYKFYANLYLKVDVEVSKELYSISMLLIWILSTSWTAAKWFFFSIACCSCVKTEKKLENPHLNIMLEPYWQEKIWSLDQISVFPCSFPPKCWAAHLRSPKKKFISHWSLCFRHFKDFGETKKLD